MALNPKIKRSPRMRASFFVILAYSLSAAQSSHRPWPSFAQLSHRCAPQMPHACMERASCMLPQREHSIKAIKQTPPRENWAAQPFWRAPLSISCALRARLCLVLPDAWLCPAQQNRARPGLNCRTGFTDGSSRFGLRDGPVCDILRMRKYRREIRTRGGLRHWNRRRSSI